MATLGANIKKIRKAAGLSQTALAERAGVSQQLINKLETGKALESRKLSRIANALGVTIDVLEAEADLAKLAQGTSENWPFELSYDRFARLPERERFKIEGVVENMVRDMERSLVGAEFKSAKKKRRRAV